MDLYGTTQVPLYLGYMYGARSWAYKNGRLTGLFKPHVWTPGVNVAQCWSGIRTPTYTPGAWFMGNRPDTPRELDDEGHEMRTCSCGFYAYNEDSNDYRQNAPVSGVVRMHGRIMRGRFGFRGERAEIVALYFRTEADVQLAEPTKSFGPQIGPPLTQLQQARVRARYRGIPVFEDFDDMVARFPVNLPAPLGKDFDQWV